MEIEGLGLVSFGITGDNRLKSLNSTLPSLTLTSVVKPIQPVGRFPTFGNNRAVHPTNACAIFWNCRFNQLGIQARKAKLLAVLAAVGSLGQLAIAAQVGEDNFATPEKNRWKQR